MDSAVLEKLEIQLPVVDTIAFVKCTLRDTTTGMYFYIQQEMVTSPSTTIDSNIQDAANGLGYVVTNLPLV